MTTFLSCDWGSSFLRVRWVNATSLSVIAEETSGKGIAPVVALWKVTGKNNQEERLLFYLDIIREQIKKIAVKCNEVLDGIPLVISGMASSSIGMMELPYGTLPFAIDGTGIITQYIATNGFNHHVLLISGIRSSDDVMRGEETQLVGCADALAGTTDPKMIIFPGTHSKHITVTNKQVTGIKTYMTGEFFDLLSNKSILNTAVEKNEDLQHAHRSAAFAKGVADAQKDNLLHTAFRVRTNDLFEIWSKKENFNYLSGLLTGTELQDIYKTAAGKVYICCSSHLRLFYEKAVEALGLSAQVTIFPGQWANEAVIRGQSRIFHQFNR